MGLNEDLVRARCQDISDSVDRLERIAQRPEGEFLQSQDLQDIACYRLLVAIEAALALCYHIAAKRLHRVPEEYAECFAALSEQALVDGELSERLQQMARFRNLLVHMYFKVDYKRVYRILQQNIHDLRAFCSEVVKLL